MVASSKLYLHQKDSLVLVDELSAKQLGEIILSELESPESHSQLSSPQSPTDLHPGSVGNVFGCSFHTHLARNDTSSSSGTNYGKPDAVIVWYCSECGDGPQGHWRDQCANCEHSKCYYCKEEET
jgi:hypothetical protein